MKKDFQVNFWENQYIRTLGEISRIKEYVKDTEGTASSEKSSKSLKPYGIIIFRNI